jgi:hypothetical protein
MTITYVGAGTTPTGASTGTGSTSVTADIHASTVTGDLMVLMVGVKPSTATIATPTGWTAVPNGSLAGGGGVDGAGTGPTLGAMFYRVADGSETSVTVSITSGSGSWGQVFTYHSSFAAFWDIQGTSGADSTTGTAWSVATSVNLGFNTDDWALAGSTSAQVGTTYASPGLSATGATFTGATLLSTPGTTTGNDAGGHVSHFSTTAGVSSTVATYTSTASVSTTNTRGVTILARIRAAVKSPPIGRSIVVMNRAIATSSTY